VRERHREVLKVLPDAERLVEHAATKNLRRVELEAPTLAALQSDSWRAAAARVSFRRRHS